MKFFVTDMVMLDIQHILDMAVMVVMAGMEVLEDMEAMGITE